MTAPAVEYEQLLARAAPYLHLHLRHPGHANQKVHGRRGGSMTDDGAIRDAFDFDDPKTGLRARVVGIRPQFRGTGKYADIMITDRDGNEVGKALRTISGDGTSVDHSRLHLTGELQGQGFASRFNANAEEMYRVSGVRKITLSTEQVGGYAWARAGYDFRRDTERREFANKMRLTADNSPHLTSSQRADMRRVANKADATPADFAMVGYTPGAKTWPGKEFMIGSMWDGQKVLDSGTRARQLDRAEMLRAIAAAYTRWSLAHADDVPYEEADAQLGDDYAEHHADISAPPAIDDILNGQVIALLARGEAAATRSTYGAVAVAGDAWLRERAQRYLAGLPHLRHPGHANQKVHGHAGGHEGPRKALREAKTIEQINTAVAKEAKRITGRDVAVDFAGHDPQIAREHGEGVLRGMERYPRTPVTSIESYGEGSGRDSAYGPNDRGTYAYNTGAPFLKNDKISFNNYYSADPDLYRTQLKMNETNRHNAAGTGTPMGIATHEFGHSVARHAGAEATAGEIAHFGRKKAGHVHTADYIKAEIGRYAMTNHKELAAEAFADVQINGDRASSLSKEIATAIDKGYASAYGEEPK